MFGLVLLLIGVLLLLWPYISDHRAEQYEDRKRREKVEMRRQYVGQAPDSPAAFEALGDAMRAAGYLEEALASFEIAKEMVSKQGAASGGGWIPGAGLDNKMHLTRVELMQERNPEQFQATLQTRPPVCGKCGSLGMPFDRDCQSCGAPLPVDGFFDSWHHKGIRKELAKDTAQMLAGLFIIWSAMLFVSFLPPLMRLTVAVSAVIVIPLRLLKKVGPD